MDKYKSLEYVINGIQAAEKIRNTYNTQLRSDSNILVKAAGLPALIEVMQIIAEFSPDIYKKSLGEVARKSNLYGNAYRNIKNHLKTSKSRSLDKDMLINTLDVIKPIMDNRQKVVIDKVLQIFQILDS